MYRYVSKMIGRIWHSPILTTWGSFVVKTFKFGIILPIILKVFTVEEVSFWFTLQIVIGLQILADMGFSSAISRAISYAKGGISRIEELFEATNNVSPSPPSGQENWMLIAQIQQVSNRIYGRIALVCFTLFSLIGTWFVLPSIERLQEPIEGYWAWGSVVLSISAAIFGNSFQAFLVGVDRIAVLRRWDILFNLLSIVLSLFAVWFYPSVLVLVVINQFFMIVTTFRNYFLVRRALAEKELGRSAVQPAIYSALWPMAWRSGLGIIMGYGVLQVGNLVYSRDLPPESSASFLLGMRLIQLVSEFSMSPFYSKIPYLNILRARGEIGRQMKDAARYMQFSYWSLLMPLGLGLGLGGWGLHFLGSAVPFPQDSVWILLSFAVLLERFGAMHLQLYSTTNRIIWHKVNFISGVIFIIIFVFTKIYVGNTYTIPFAYLGANLLFYGWYCARQSYQLFEVPVWQFERRALFPPFIGFLFLVSISLSIKNLGFFY